jgi:hypothetical protein
LVAQYVRLAKTPAQGLKLVDAALVGPELRKAQLLSVRRYNGTTNVDNRSCVHTAKKAGDQLKLSSGGTTFCYPNSAGGLGESALSEDEWRCLRLLTDMVQKDFIKEVGRQGGLGLNSTGMTYFHRYLSGKLPLMDKDQAIALGKQLVWNKDQKKKDSSSSSSSKGSKGSKRSSDGWLSFIAPKRRG